MRTDIDRRCQDFDLRGQIGLVTWQTAAAILGRPFHLTVWQAFVLAYVTSLFARKMVAAAGSGIDPRATLGAAGIDHDAPWDPKHMIPAVAYYDMLEAMAEQGRCDGTAGPCGGVHALR